MRGQKRERILRVLLQEPKLLSKSGLSKKAQCTRQWIILFLRELEKNKLVTTAEVTEAVAKQIVVEAKMGNEASLNITVPFYPEGEAQPQHFSFAC